MADSQDCSNERLFNYFGERILSLSEDSQTIYRRALKALDTFLNAHRLNLADLSEEMVFDWAAELLGSGLAFRSMVQFVDVLSSLVNAAVKDGLMAPTKAVKSAKAVILASKNSLAHLDERNQLPRLLSLLRMAGHSLGENEIYRDILLLSLLNGAMPLVEVAKLKRDDVADFDENSMSVINRHLNHRRRYVFNLRQSELTPNQLKKDIYGNIIKLLNRYVDPSINNPDDALYSFWVMLAIKCGTRCSIALGCVPFHVDLYQPAFVTRHKAEESVRRSLSQAVGQTIVNNPPRWYAMHLRRHTNYEEVKAAIEATTPQLQEIELFYPSEEIALRVGKKLVHQNQPLIRDIVFFKTRVTDIPALFRSIGDKAWCYRVSNSPGAPYAMIPKTDFDRFQIAIGHFTPETEILPLSAATPLPGEEVVLIGSIWGERKGTFNKTITDKTGKLLYRILLTPDSGFAFHIDIDPRSVQAKNVFS